jgi:hypothetical protein
MTRYRVLPYKAASNSARLLAEALGGKRIRLENSRYVPRSGDVVVNWGNSRLASLCTLNGGTGAIETAANKLYFFQHNEDAEWLPRFWTEPEEINDDDFPVVARTVLNGHSGVGAVVCDSRDDLVSAPLYVKYIPKKEEYRVHLGLNLNKEHFKVDIIAIQQKKRRLDYANPDWKIRNHANGFVYAREGVDPPVGVLDVAMHCLVRSGLDFGAVDVIWNEHQGKAYCLEINTAPGLEGQTVLDYVNYFKSWSQ